jgi:hypothetical protein
MGCSEERSGRFEWMVKARWMAMPIRGEQRSLKLDIGDLPCPRRQKQIQCSRHPINHPTIEARGELLIRSSLGAILICLFVVGCKRCSRISCLAKVRRRHEGGREHELRICRELTDKVRSKVVKEVKGKRKHDNKSQ